MLEKLLNLAAKEGFHINFRINKNCQERIFILKSIRNPGLLLNDICCCFIDFLNPPVSATLKFKRFLYNFY